MEQDGIDYSHLKDYRKFVNIAFPLEEVMVENSTYSRFNLKQRIIKGGLLEYKCQQCGQGPLWKGKKLALVLDHINGIPNDHRKENLRFLCPNCNSQTDTFAGRNIEKSKKKICPKCGGKKYRAAEFCKKCSAKIPRSAEIPRPELRKVVRPSKEELHKMLWEMPSTKIAAKYGVSGKAVEKWAKFYKIEKPPRGYWTKQKAMEQ